MLLKFLKAKEQTISPSSGSAEKDAKKAMGDWGDKELKDYMYNMPGQQDFITKYAEESYHLTCSK